jgi:hypothetical protein
MEEQKGDGVMRMFITPKDVLLDQAVSIQVSNVRPGAIVRLRIRNHTLKAESTADFVTPAHGTVDVSLSARRRRLRGH